MSSETKTLSYQDLLADLPSSCPYDVCSVDVAMDALKKADHKKDIDVCSTCGLVMDKCYNEYQLVCSNCAATVTVGNDGEHTIGASDGHNTSSNAYMSFKPVGIKNRLYQNAMIKYTSVYEPFRDAQIMNGIKQYNFISKDWHLPPNIQTAAGELFIQLKEHDYVRRGKSRRGVLGACIYVECQRAKITKTVSQIAKMMKVDDAKITFGLKELQHYHNEGKIDIPQNHDPTSDFVNSYFEDFEIDERYKKFALELLARIAEKKIVEIESCHTTTKCIGVIYLLNVLLKLNITHEKIALKCDNISRGTYLNIYNAIIKNEEKLRKAFVRNNMPLPAGWTKKADAKDEK